jgi:bacteriocin biosynthesis cyclodehydratase domain-containing protein
MRRRIRPFGTMRGMFRLDPAATPLWRTPDCLQFGSDPVLAVLPRVSVDTEFLLAALAEGADREHLDDLADRRKLPPSAVDDLLAALAPVLEGPPAPRPVTLIDGPPDLLASLVRRLEPLGCAPPASGGSRPDLVLLAAHHVLLPARSVRWLAVDVPHLPVVFGDQAVHLGPLVVPGETPCLRCADEHRLDAEPAWPALAAQLMSRPPARTSGSPLVRLAAEAHVVAALRERASGAATGLEGAALRIDAAGRVSRLERPWHGRCSCRSLAPAA